MSGVWCSVWCRRRRGDLVLTASPHVPSRLLAHSGTSLRPASTSSALTASVTPSSSAAATTGSSLLRTSPRRYVVAPCVVFVRLDGRPAHWRPGMRGLRVCGTQGKDVLLLERRGVLGGAAVTEEIVPGFKFSRGSCVASASRRVHRSGARCATRNICPSLSLTRTRPRGRGTTGTWLACFAPRQVAAPSALLLLWCCNC